jgi:SSS family transporter
VNEIAALFQAATIPATTRPAVVAVAVAYFAGVAAIDAWAARRTRTASDFFVAGRRVGIVPLGLAAMSATVSGFAFIGGPGFVYTAGVGAMYLVLSASVTGSMTAWVLAKRLRMLGEIRGLITLPDAIAARYDSRAAQGLSAVAILVGVIGYMATNVLALGLVIDAVFGTGLAAGIWLGTGVTVAYSVAGGILAGVYTDVLQGALMALSSVLVFLFAIQTGGAGAGLAGISETIRAADPEFFGPWGRLGPTAALSLFFVFGMGALVQPHVAHKFYMLRDARQLRWYPLIMSVALMLTLLLYFAVGIAVKALAIRGALPAPVSPDQTTPLFLLHFTPVLLAALVFSGVAAAIMSTVNSFMNIGAAAVTHDLPRAIGKRVSNELLWGRISTLGISVLAAALAQYSGILVAFLGIFGWGLFASTLVPALAIGLNWEGATRAGAVASIATGLGLTLLLETLAYFRVYSFPAGVSVAGASLVLSFIVFFIVSWITGRGKPVRIDDDVRAVMEL